MASLRKHPRSPYWHACFTLPDGTRTNRSTGTRNRREARRIGDEFEAAARDAASGALTEARVRKTLSDIYSFVNKEGLSSATVRGFLEGWLERKEREAGAATHEKYRGVVVQFLDSLGSRSEGDVRTITAADVVRFRDGLATRLAPSTVNLAVKIIRGAFAQARRDGLVDTNEAERVTLLRKFVRETRRPFTIGELKRVLEVSDREWKGMILAGIYTGLRLGDVAGLTWNNVDLDTGELQLRTRKTGRPVVIPMAGPLLRYIKELDRTGGESSSPLFPEAAAVVARTGRAGSLSNRFRQILVAAGLAEARTHEGSGKGRAAKRETQGLSFHCLRHTATSLLKNAGVSDAVARDIIGHESAMVSRNYTHIDSSAKRAAVDLLPDVTG